MSVIILQYQSNVSNTSYNQHVVSPPKKKKKTKTQSKWYQMIVPLLHMLTSTGSSLFKGIGTRCWTTQDVEVAPIGDLDNFRTTWTRPLDLFWLLHTASLVTQQAHLTAAECFGTPPGPRSRRGSGAASVPPRSCTSSVPCGWAHNLPGFLATVFSKSWSSFLVTSGKAMSY